MLGGIYMRNLAPARVLYWDDFFISYLVFMMLGYFISRLFEGEGFMVIKYNCDIKSQTLRMRYPFQSTGRRFHTETDGRYAFT